MARVKQVDTKIQVTRGFVTEFTPVGFPQEAAIDVDNCIIDSDGSVRRRPGVDLEQSFVLNKINAAVLQKGDLESVVINNFLWRGVANSGTLNIIVVQVGLILQFYAQIGSVSANLLGETDLTAFAVSAVEAQAIPLRFSAGMGSLFVTSERMELLQIQFIDGLFVVTPVLIKQRDFEGLDDGLAVDIRPNVLTRNHYYNLKNQGWIDENILKFAGLPTDTNICAGTGDVGGLPGSGGIGGIPTFTGSPVQILAQIAIWLSQNNGSDGAFPSNSDIMSVGIVVNSDGDLEFDANFIREDFAGNTPAPKGHFILDAFSKDYDLALDCPGTGSEITLNRPEGIAFHNGRVFFSSPVVQNRVSGIFYSQNLLDDDRVGLCFQAADPTASEINDLIATDGGFLPTPEIGQIITMEEFGNGVIILASNGVWYLTGAELGAGVTATSLRMEKVHASGVLSAASVVQAAGVLFYWGVEGIMSCQIGENGIPTATSITQTSIQTFYVNISAAARATATGVYIPEQNKVYWGYHDTAKDATPDKRNINKVLILDLDIKGWYKYSVAEDSGNNFPEIRGMSKVAALSAGAEQTENVTDSLLEVVVDSTGAVVTSTSIIEGSQVSTLKMATMVYSTLDSGYKLTFSSFTDRQFIDWTTAAPDGIGKPMDSFIEFAEFNLGAIHTKGTPTYVHSYFSKDSKNLAPGGYYELPPRFYKSAGLRVTQSVVEVLYSTPSDLRVTQSVIEVLSAT